MVLKPWYGLLAWGYFSFTWLFICQHIKDLISIRVLRGPLGVGAHSLDQFLLHLDIHLSAISMIYSA
jgi:hypothetical protein